MAQIFGNSLFSVKELFFVALKLVNLKCNFTLKLCILQDFFFFYGFHFCLGFFFKFLSGGNIFEKNIELPCFLANLAMNLLHKIPNVYNFRVRV